MKDEIFESDFDDLYKIVETCKNNNIRLGEQIIQQHWIKFNSKFENQPFEKLVDDIVNLFSDNQTVFLQQNKFIDRIVQLKYERLLYIEKIQIINKQKSVSVFFCLLSI